MIVRRQVFFRERACLLFLFVRRKKVYLNSTILLRLYNRMREGKMVFLIMLEAFIEIIILNLREE
ncbi:hypothetical protein J2Z66_007110 [Paenibacillus eucommiae]|uniref:Uncharacterized protein n=1 Tax=Paenibacillus eucommiae TaxID=1355755 RepID=A0ABS4J6L1_9BACL|nr:hypothetical protein [Paenibacillus eucommiae]